jgi:hypothetical protein
MESITMTHLKNTTTRLFPETLSDYETLTNNDEDPNND